MHHCRPRDRSPEIVAYTAPLRDAFENPVDENSSDIGDPGFDPIHRAGDRAALVSRSSHRGGVCDRPADVRRTGIARAGALDQLPQVDWRDDPGPFGAEAAVAVFAPPADAARIDAALAAQCHALGARGDVLILLYRSAGRLGVQLG